MSQRTATGPRRTLAETGMTFGLRALNGLAGSPLLDRLGIREPTQRILGGATRTTVRTANRAGRTFAATTRLAVAQRQPRRAAADLFDLTPDDEQRMLVEAVSDFARDRVRPAASAADLACATPHELLAQSSELGLTMIGVPEALGGVLESRAAVTTVLMSEALARGDLGVAAACLAPAAVATAISLWGDADQQATYLPAFVAEQAPAAALALAEPQALADPRRPGTTARRSGGGYVLDGVKALVPRAAEAELLIVSAALEDGRTGLFIVESAAAGLVVEPDPAIGLRPAATGRVHLEGTMLPAGALLGDGDPAVISECLALGRIAWSALAAGTGRAVLDYVAEYVNGRTAFGEPVSHRQAVAFAVADIAIELEGIRLATLRAAARADQGLPFVREAALARDLVRRHGMAIGSNGVGLLGGHGFTREHPVERWYRDLRAAGVIEGVLLV